MKQFVFMYPVKRKFDLVISNLAYPPRGILKEEPYREMMKNLKENRQEIIDRILNENIKRFKPFYKKKLNCLIQERYRTNGFSINYFVYNGDEISEIIDLHKEDRIFEVGVSWETHSLKNIYPNNNQLINSLGEITQLAIGGFYWSDCVKKLFESAKNRNINCFIDEDLTDRHKEHSFFNYH